MVDILPEIASERVRIRDKYGDQSGKSFRDWAKVIIRQAGDLYLTAFVIDPAKLPLGEARKQVVQIAAACLECLESA